MNAEGELMDKDKIFDGDGLFNELVKKGTEGLGDVEKLRVTLAGYKPDDVDLAIKIAACLVALADGIFDGTLAIDMYYQRENPRQCIIGGICGENYAFGICTAGIVEAVKIRNDEAAARGVLMSQKVRILAMIAGKLRTMAVKRKIVEPFTGVEAGFVPDDDLDDMLLRLTLMAAILPSDMVKGHFKMLDTWAVEMSAAKKLQRGTSVNELAGLIKTDAAEIVKNLALERNT